MTDYTIEGQVGMFDQDIWSGKTFAEPSQVESQKEQTSQRSSRKSSKSQSRMPMCVCVSRKTDGQNQGATTLTMEDGVLLGEYTMHSFGEYPNEENVSRLSQILEVCPLPTYSLSAKACEGILRRAEKRGKALPPTLKEALERQVGHSKLGGGVEIDSAGKKAGKGALVQTERAGTIGVSQDQTLITIPMEGNGARPSHHGDGYGKEGDPMFSLNTTEQHAVSIHGDIAGTLDSNYYKGCGERQGTERDVVYQPMVYDNHATDARVTECGETAPTVAARYGTGGNNTPLVYEHRKQDARVKELGDVAPTVEAAFGAGGNNTPLVISDGAVCIGNGQVDQLGLSDKVGALNCMHDQQAVITYGIDRATFNQGANALYKPQITEELSATCVAKGPNAVYQSVVRRLTPLECERLQGYPDNYTDIGEWIDEKGKTRKTTDSARYKALGNSIALPFWFWLLRRISAQYERVATLGSLFDGLSGFPLCWERCNGRGTALWTSEIEPFCIAVCKKHFGDSENGIKGDIGQYL